MSKTTKVYGSKFKHKFDGDVAESSNHDEYHQRKKEKRLKSMLRSKSFTKESFPEEYLEDY